MEYIIRGIEIGATIASVNLLWSPMKSIQNIKKNKLIVDVTLLPILSMFVNCFLWVIYGYIADNIFPLAITNCIGVLLTLYYILIYYKFATNKSDVQKSFLVGSFIILGTIIYATYSVKPINLIKQDVGIICCIICVCMYAAPLSSLAVVIKTKSAASMPLPIILAGLLNSILWLIYGILLNDPYVLFPNILSIALGGIQLGVIFKYKGSPKMPSSPIEKEQLFPSSISLV